MSIKFSVLFSQPTNDDHFSSIRSLVYAHDAAAHPTPNLNIPHWYEFLHHIQTSTDTLGSSTEHVSNGSGQPHATTRTRRQMNVKRDHGYGGWGEVSSSRVYMNELTDNSDLSTSRPVSHLLSISQQTPGHQIVQLLDILVVVPERLAQRQWMGFSVRQSKEVTL